MPEKNPSLEWSSEEISQSAPEVLSQESQTMDLEKLQELTQEESTQENQNIWVESLDLSTVSLQDDEIWSESGEDKTLDEMDLNSERWDIDISKLNKLDVESVNTTPIDQSVFLDSWEENVKIKVRPVDDIEHFWTYLRWFFFSSIISLLGVLVAGLFFSFNTYINKASQITLNIDDQQYVNQYKDKLDKVKEFFKRNYKDNYIVPQVWSEKSLSMVNEIINAADIDYIEKRDLLKWYVPALVSKAQDNAVYLESLKQDIARQWFLPEELEIILTEDEAIDTIQRSLNALEVIKFSTATKVFSYMNTALATISEMVRINWSTVENLSNLFNQLNWRWEKDITAYVYMCHLNPYETSANCDTIWDLDLYYNSIIKDGSINLKLFKNSMNAISQLLEKEDTSLFSITFNWFNAQDENIQFNIEVYTSQEDERSLMAQWKRNPNIFILTNIINLLKQSSFIIWSEINTKEVNVETKTLTRGGLSRMVNYSTMDFTVPIQKDTEREIFDYIDLDSLEEMLKKWKEGNETGKTLEQSSTNNLD